MSLFEEEFFYCPYCCSQNMVTIDISGGQHQEFVNDCEICCQPILITIELQGENLIALTANKENF